MHQSQIDRASGSLETPRVRNFSNRDNSFATARDLGTLFSSIGQPSIRASGSIGKSDRKDVFKLRLAPGFSASSSSGIITIRGGALRYSLYSASGNERPQLVGSQRLTAGIYQLPSLLPVPPLPFAIRGYIVFDRPTRNVRYSLRESYRP